MKYPLFLAASLLLAPLALAQRGPVDGFSTATPYLIHYGNWDPARVNAARTGYRLVILHPVSNITPADVASIRSGPDNIAGTADDVIVLAYISVGEDDRPAAPYAGDGNGPRIDPRSADSEPLSDVDPLGNASPGGTGFASYYLDDEDQDGIPDTNSTFGGEFINPGDPAWYQVIKNNVKGTDGVSGLDEIMTTTTGIGYGCDGVFMDTLDTPAPNSFGATLYEWTAPAYQQLVKSISDDYPGKILLGNRGLFFYNPNLKTYAYTLRPYVNFILFESYYTDSSGSGMPSAFFDDNKFNFAPKINAEASRPDGFTVLCLGYTSSGEPASLEENDFIESQKEQGWPLYRTDPSLNSPFNTDAATWNAANPDVSAPVWDSTAATVADSDPVTPGNQAPAPRIGIQAAIADEGKVTVRWDVARDQTGPVRYNIYYTDQAALNFGTATKLAAVESSVPSDYGNGGGSSASYSSEYTVTGLANGTTYQFAVRAEDALSQEDNNSVVLSATPALTPSDYREIAIDGSFSDWAGAAVLDDDPEEFVDPDFAEVNIANDANFLYIRFTLHFPAAAFIDFNSHVFIDTDNNASTGFVPGGSTMGSDFMIESGIGYDQRAGGFNDGGTSGVSWSVIEDDFGSPTEYELRISRSSLYSSDSSPVFPGDTIRVMLQDNAGDITAPEGIKYRFAPTPPPASQFAAINIDGDFSDWDSIPAVIADPTGDGNPDIVSIKVANDVDYLYLLVEYAGGSDVNNFNSSPSTFLSLDNDNNPSTGFDIYGLGEVGADVTWQNNFPFSQEAGVFNSASTFADAVPGIAPYAVNTSAQEYRIPRTATFDGGGGSEPLFPQNTIRLAFWTDGPATEFAGGFTYAFASPPSYYATISVDGDPSDWASIPAILADAIGDGDPDIVSIKAANDDKYLYLLVEYAGAVDTNNFNGSPSTFLSLDNDHNTATGFDTFGLGRIGAEVSWQNNFAFSQAAGIFNVAGTTFANAIPAISPYFSNTSFQEYCIDRSATLDSGAGSTSIFPNGTFRLAFWTDGTPSDFVGGFSYQFAANTGQDPYNDWKLTYFDHLQLSDPQVGGDNTDPDLDGLVNLLEFATGGNPLSFNGGPAAGTMAIGQDRYLTVTYNRRIDGSVTVLPESSSSLSDWNDDPLQFVTVSTTPLGGNLEQVVIRTSAKIPTAPKFIRIKVGLN
jgi:hypothetical protein